MSRTPKKPPLALDIDFSEALTRFVNADPDELPHKLKPKRLKRKSNPIDEDSTIVLDSD